MITFEKYLFIIIRLATYPIDQRHEREYSQRKNILFSKFNKVCFTNNLTKVCI